MKILSFFRSNGRRLDDWLSPILIKELRQGMRARVFVLSFLLLQVFLILLVMGNVAAADDRYTLNSQNHYFWLLVAFILLLLMPLRGLTAISHEVRQHTMETIILTRMTAWRVVFGKWSALFAQSLLFTSAVLPYIAIRYFVGGEEIVSDFIQLFILLWLSAILISVSIAISSAGIAVVRVILLIALVISLVAAMMAQSDIFGGQVFPFDVFLKVLGWLLLFGFFVPALLFEISATTIAATSENHAVRRRLLALFFYGIGLLLSLNESTRNPTEVFPMLALIGICYFELSEKPRLLSRQVRPLRRFGGLGGIIGIFLLPGWPSALLFTLATVPFAMWCTLGMAFRNSGASGSEATLIPLSIYAVLGSVLVPMLICHLLWTRMKQVLLMIFLYNVIMLAVTWILESFSTLTNSMLYDVLAFIPSVPAFMDYTNWNRNNGDVYLAGNSLMLCALLVICVPASRPFFSELFSLLRAPKPDSPDNPVKPAATP